MSSYRDHLNGNQLSVAGEELAPVNFGLLQAWVDEEFRLPAIRLRKEVSLLFQWGNLGQARTR